MATRALGNSTGLIAYARAFKTIVTISSLGKKKQKATIEALARVHPLNSQNCQDPLGNIYLNVNALVGLSEKRPSSSSLLGTRMDSVSTHMKGNEGRAEGRVQVACVAGVTSLGKGKGKTDSEGKEDAIDLLEDLIVVTR